MTRDNDYAARIEAALDFIADHVDEDLSLERIAHVACFSPFHFHRIYSAMVGETVSETVKRLRLHRAARELLREHRSIERIARQAGYTSQSAFTRAFRKAYGIPPARYRGQTIELQKRMKGDSNMFKVDLVEGRTIPVASLAHRGDYIEIGTVFEKLFATAGGLGLITGPIRSFGIYYDDPGAVAKENRRSEACLMVSPDWKSAGGLEAKAISGGRYAQIEHVGPYSELHSSYDWLLGTWLPTSGEEVDDRPCVEEYLSNQREVPPAELRTMIWLPIREKSPR